MRRRATALSCRRADSPAPVAAAAGLAAPVVGGAAPPRRSLTATWLDRLYSAAASPAAAGCGPARALPFLSMTLLEDKFTVLQLASDSGAQRVASGSRLRVRQDRLVARTARHPSARRGVQPNLDCCAFSYTGRGRAGHWGVQGTCGGRRGGRGTARGGRARQQARGRARRRRQRLPRRRGRGGGWPCVRRRRGVCRG